MEGEDEMSLNIVEPDVSGDGHDDDGNDWDVVSNVGSVQSCYTFSSILQVPSDSGDSASGDNSSSKSIPKSIPLVATQASRRQNNRADSASDHCFDGLQHAAEGYFLDNEKPLAKKHRKKHEREGRKQLLKGHTGRRHTHHSKETWEASVVNESLSYNPIVEDTFGHPPFSGLNRRRQWEDLPALLEDQTLTTPRTCTENVHGRGHRTVTKYHLSAKSPTNHRAEPQEDERIYCIPAVSASCTFFSSKCIPRKLFAIVNKERPEHVVGEPLEWQVIAHSSRRGYPRTRKPIVHSTSCWDPLEQRGSMTSPNGNRSPEWLEIDLGRTTTVTAISTQGGPPPIRFYPEVVRRDGTWWVEGYASAERYSGPYWRVLDPKKKSIKNKRQSLLRWVRSYEILWRGNRGRQWNSLGVFAGNQDTVTEVGHLLTGYQEGGVNCRYLRIVPRDCENGGALRLQVYGVIEGSNGTDQQKEAGRVADEVDDDRVVEYTLHHASPLQDSSLLVRSKSEREWCRELSDPKYFRSRRPKLKRQLMGREMLE